MIENPETRMLGFVPLQELWSMLNRTRTEQGRSKSSLQQSPFYICEIEQTIKDIVEECPITKFEGGIAKLQEDKTEPINWLNGLETPL